MTTRPECLQLIAGCGTELLFSVTDEDGVAVSLTGNRVRFAVRRNFEDEFADMVVVKDSDNGATEVEILTTPNDHQAVVKITSTDTEDLEEGDYNVSVTVSIGTLCYRAYYGFLKIAKSMLVP